MEVLGWIILIFVGILLISYIAYQIKEGKEFSASQVFIIPGFLVTVFYYVLHTLV